MKTGTTAGLLLSLALLLLSHVNADVSHLKPHKRTHDDEDRHYLPPEPEIKHEKQHKHHNGHEPHHEHRQHQEHHLQRSHKRQHHHEEPKLHRVDHFHHYDRKPDVKPKTLHYPYVQQSSSRVPIYTQERPNHLLYSNSPNSVFHTQINVQSQDAELNSQLGPGSSLPVQNGLNGQSGVFPPSNLNFPPPNGGINFPINGGPLPVINGQRAATISNDNLQLVRSLQPSTVPINNGLARTDTLLGRQLDTNGRPTSQLPLGQVPSNQVPANQFSTSQLLANQLAADQLAVNQRATNRRTANQLANNQIAADQLLANEIAADQRAINQRANSQLRADQLDVNQRTANQLANSQLRADQFTESNRPAADQLAANQLANSQRRVDQLAANGLSAGQIPDNQLLPLASNRVSMRVGQRNRANYQGVNVLNGNIIGEPRDPQPLNGLSGNVQRSNIINGNYVASQRQRQAGPNIDIYAFNAADDDDVVDFALAASAPEVIYAPGGGLKGAASSKVETDYRDDGYHYGKPGIYFEF